MSKRRIALLASLALLAAAPCAAAQAAPLWSVDRPSAGEHGDLRFQHEAVQIDVNAALWHGGASTLHRFFGGVDLDRDAGGWGEGGQGHASFGDSQWLRSRLFVEHERGCDPGDGGAQLPEPGAAVVFAIGAVLVARRTARASRI